jgi:hypothetical protein
VGYTTKPREPFLPPHFSKLLENSSGGAYHQANGIFPASTSPKASRIFYPGLTPPKRTEFPSRLQATRSFHQKVIHPPRARAAKYIPNLGCNELTDPLLVQRNRRSVPRTVTPPEHLISTIKILITYKQYDLSVKDAYGYIAKYSKPSL